MAPDAGAVACIACPVRSVIRDSLLIHSVLRRADRAIREQQWHERVLTVRGGLSAGAAWQVAMRPLRARPGGQQSGTRVLLHLRGWQSSSCVMRYQLSVL